MAERAPAILCLTGPSADLAARITAAVGGAVHGRAGRGSGTVTFDDTVEHIRSLFASGTPIIGLCAAGILIRAVAPLLSDKRAEPPVLAVAEDGSAVVPLLGGHRGANDLAREIAAVCDRPLKMPVVEVPEQDPEAATRAGIEIADPELCTRYVGRIVVNAIREQQFYVLTHPHWKNMIEARMRTILDQTDPVGVQPPAK